MALSIRSPRRPFLSPLAAGLMFLLVGLLPVDVPGFWRSWAADPTGSDPAWTAWRLRYFGATYASDPRSAEDADPDGDGAANRTEFLDGTDPTHPRSVEPIPVRVSTYAGGVWGYRDGALAEAAFSYPRDLALDSRGRLWVTESSHGNPPPAAHRIRLIDTNGVVSTVAGTDQEGDQEGLGVEATFNTPQTPVFDHQGNTFIGDLLNCRVRMIDPHGRVSTFAGSTRGYQNGPATQAQFSTVQALCYGPDGFIYVADWENLCVRRVAPDGTVSLFAGRPGQRGATDGPRLSATFHTPTALAFGPNGECFVGDWANGMVRVIHPDGEVRTFASGRIYMHRLIVDAKGSVYTTHFDLSSGGDLTKFRPDGSVAWTVRTPAGMQDGPMNEARFAYLFSPVLLPDGDILVSDQLNHRIRRIHMAPPVQVPEVDPRAPVILTQPRSQEVSIGESLVLSVAVKDPGGLSYQWFRDGRVIPGATRFAYTLASVRSETAGSYTVRIANADASVLSAAAEVRVVPARELRLSSASGKRGESVSLSLGLVARGNENGLGFSLQLDTPGLEFAGFTPAASLVDRGAQAITHRAASNVLGVVLMLPGGQALPSGDVALGQFTVDVAADAPVGTVQLRFTDVPVRREVVDTNAAPLKLSFVDGTLEIVEPITYEADLTPSPNGGGGVDIADWVWVGRLVAGLELPRSTDESQRADCAPRQLNGELILGDGVLSVADFAQAGRYAVGLDPVTETGGPRPAHRSLAESPRPTVHLARLSANSRRVTLLELASTAQSVLLGVAIDARGDENALGFSLAFDPQSLRFLGSEPSAEFQGAALLLNDRQAAQGRLGIGWARPAGEGLSPGATVILRLRFAPLADGLSRSPWIRFADEPVRRAVVGISSAEVQAIFEDLVLTSGVLAEASPLSAQFDSLQGRLVLGWPESIQGAVVEYSDTLISPQWRAVVEEPRKDGVHWRLEIRPTSTAGFYRLRSP